MTMALFTQKINPKPWITNEAAKRLKMRFRQLLGLILIFLGTALFSLLISYNSEDPSFRNATNQPAKNFLGQFGSYFADPLHLGLGLASFSFSVFFIIWGWRFLTNRGCNEFIRRMVFVPLAISTLAMFFAAHPPKSSWPFEYGLGGAFGDTALSLFLNLNLFEIDLWLKIVTIILSILVLFLCCYTAGVRTSEMKRTISFFINSLKSLIHLIYSPKIQNKGISEYTSSKVSPNSSFLTKEYSKPDLNVRVEDKISEVIKLRQENKNIDLSTILPENYGSAVISQNLPPPLGGVTKKHTEGGIDQKNLDIDSKQSSTRKNISFSNGSLASRVKYAEVKKQHKSAKAREEEQPQLAFEDKETLYKNPELSLLENPAQIVRHHLSDDALNENARMLENVLDDYGIRGEIVSVRPGPVVTLYELEPAAGLKASRVISLSDDIARSMSALSARVSTIPGKSVIGIELPNSDREKVLLREILSSSSYGDSKFQLPLVLGKDIGGSPVVANLARMPHLLIAGTTGSGKSVGINTMILSLLYRLSPDECRLIMIDPKMLELSVYDGIPHLLSPVVTDPRKAVVALKWAVAEMEERYRRMSKLGVRNIDGYNLKVHEALSNGDSFSRTVQTGFDDKTGEPIFETQYFKPDKMPYIVIIVDEMADLMMVAGKEIEACIQRLAQMARAAGIHLIMATQRPSVDVITGTIKANFPTRISFQVTSKIDSRTILGEMGAEQLLGMGDMLYMANGGRITRIHSPFVSDEEVEEVVSFLKSQGSPSYVEGVLEGPSAEAEARIDQAMGLGTNDSENKNSLYDYAVAIVSKDRKCSTSYIQRKLSIGYNRAAKIVELMEENGVVSQANHVGKRQILVPEHHG